MFQYKQLSRVEVERFETPYNENFLEIHLVDRSVDPTAGDGGSAWQPVHCVMPARYCQFAERIRNLTVYEDDVWIVTFPKAGTTWAQEMLWLIDHNLDYKTATAVDLQQRSIFLEVFGFVTNIDLPDSITLVEEMPRPRHIKTHLPLALLPRELWTINPKIVYVARNPKDVTTSFMHHYRHLHGFKGLKQDFLDGILQDRIIYCPQVKHATEFWRVANHRRHVLFLHFEDMKRNLSAVLRQVCAFMGKTYSKKQLAHLEEHLSFEKMKNNKSANNQALVIQFSAAIGKNSNQFTFMRKGQIGAYRNELPEDFSTKFDELISVQLSDTDFRYRE
ncbi:luciferin sulfotransferase-like [Sabethes cyaneus]|uniref:luciferin sulfotransferase-like n=1 Tax=Sabethes cyaneus TaxID=53552 RepID=UPI00237D7875|nr:luciferin sulfotransferase-like [Sabethes cyaneus]